MLSGIFATPTLRNSAGPPSSGAHPGLPAPASGGASEAADGPPRASRAFAGGVAPPRARRRLGGDPGAVCGHGGAPAGAGAFGSAFEVFQDVRQVCGVVAAELFEEVDFNVHRGFLSLFPPCCTSILSTATPPCQAPAVCSPPHFMSPYATVTYFAVTFADVGVGYTYEPVTYHGVTYSPVTFVSVTYHGVTYTYVAVTYGYVGKGCH